MEAGSAPLLATTARLAADPASGPPRTSKTNPTSVPVPLTAGLFRVRPFRRRTRERPIHAVIAADHFDEGMALLGSLTLNFSAPTGQVDEVRRPSVGTGKAPAACWGKARANRTMADCVYAKARIMRNAEQRVCLVPERAERKAV